MTSKAIWLLDIDGVINACPRIRDPLPAAWPRSDWIDVKVANRHSDTAWPILASRSVVEFINRVDDEGLATIMWHSTWQDESNAVAKAIGLHEFEVLETNADVTSKLWWKLPAARSVLTEYEGHVVWTDDDAAPPDLPNGERRIWRDAGALIVAPNPYQGLVRANLDRIRFYLTGGTDE